MGDFFGDGFPHILLWFVGALVLGLALVYGVMRAGRISGRDRQLRDDATRRVQRQEDVGRTDR